MTKIVNILNSKPLSEQPLNHGEGLLVPLEYTGDICTNMPKKPLGTTLPSKYYC